MAVWFALPECRIVIGCLFLIMQLPEVVLLQQLLPRHPMCRRLVGQEIQQWPDPLDRCSRNLSGWIQEQLAALRSDAAEFGLKRLVCAAAEEQQRFAAHALTGRNVGGDLVGQGWALGSDGLEFVPERDVAAPGNAQ